MFILGIEGYIRLLILSGAILHDGWTINVTIYKFLKYYFMNQNEKNPVLITQEDYNLLKPYFTGQNVNSNEMSLSAELSRAIIVKDEAFPPHAIRLNSRVWIAEENTGETMELSIVLPKYADIKQKKVSVLTPIAAALIGFRKGDSVKWKVPAGMKVFKIVEVLTP